MDYTRNRLRNQVFPALKEAIPEWQKGLDRSLENLDFFVRHPHYKDELKRRQEIRYGQPYLKLDGLATKDAAHYLVLWLQNEVLLPLPEMERWLNSQRGAQFTKAQVELELGPDVVYHLTNPTGGSQVNIREKGRQAIVLEGLLKGGFQGYVQTEIRVNPEHLTFPLEIRPWRKGDSFDPQGGRGQKLVSDYLTDLKLPRFVKEQTHVLLSGLEIVWLVG